MHELILSLFSISWILIIILFNLLIARGGLSFKLDRAFLYVITMASIGVAGELLFDSIYNLVFKRPLWQYRLYPIHQGYTSIYSVYLWGSIGLFLYLFHDTLRKKRVTSTLVLVLLFCIDAIVFEVLVNLSYKAIFKNFLFYYLPNDLWHITTVQVIPLYLLAGAFTIYALNFAKTRQKAAIIGSTLVTLSVVCGGILAR